MENEELAKLIYSGRHELTEQLYNQNKAYIYACAKRYYINRQERLIKCGAEFEDLISEGYFALLAAVEAYCKKETEYRFITFLKYPLLNRFNALAGYRSKADRYNPLNNSLSLDAPISEDDTETTLGELTEDKTADFENELVHQITSCKVFETVKNILKDYPGLYKIIYMRFSSGMKSNKIAEALHCKYEDVRKCEREAFKILRGTGKKELEEYFNTLISVTCRMGGISYFKSTHTSCVEWAVGKLCNKGDKYAKTNRLD